MPKTKRKPTAGQRHARQRQEIKLARQGGVIFDIQDSLIKAKEKDAPVTTEDILKHLVKKHPDREEQGMLITIRAQLSRLPKEKNFPIERVREGRNVMYKAA